MRGVEGRPAGLRECVGRRRSHRRRDRCCVWRFSRVEPPAVVAARLRVRLRVLPLKRVHLSLLPTHGHTRRVAASASLISLNSRRRRVSRAGCGTTLRRVTRRLLVVDCSRRSKVHARRCRLVHARRRCRLSLSWRHGCNARGGNVMPAWRSTARSEVPFQRDDMSQNTRAWLRTCPSQRLAARRWLAR